jgi:tetratricopeptide (TPR) repeat protein
MPDRLRPLWDFDDLEASEERFRDQLAQERDDAGRAEVLTQLARVAGLRADFERCAELLAEADALGGSNALARIRLELERGRMLRSSGDPSAAFPLFESAYARAREAEEPYFAGDAAHMCAIATDDRRRQEEWTQRGLAEGDSYWAGPLLNNLGWAYFEDGEYERALELFERALRARERDPANRPAIAWAHYALAKTFRMLGRRDDALAAAEAAATILPDDPYVEEELAAVQVAR